MIKYLKHGWGLFSVVLCLTVIIPISTIIFFFLIPGDENMDPPARQCIKLLYI